ncbi:MAG: hypothetical protein AB1352_05285 [Patescibacteria group bacterium]
MENVTVRSIRIPIGRIIALFTICSLALFALSVSFVSRQKPKVDQKKARHIVMTYTR